MAKKNPKKHDGRGRSAELSQIEGRSLEFLVKAHDGPVLVAEGLVERILVDRAKFIAHATADKQAD